MDLVGGVANMDIVGSGEAHYFCLNWSYML